MKSSSGPSSAFLIAFLFTVGAASAPSAQSAGGQSRPPTPAARGAAPAQSQDAPIVQFAAEGISVDEAIKLTFQYDPNLHRQDATVDYQEGVVQEQRGPFDLTFLGSVNTNHRTQELTQSRKNSENDKRTKLDQQIASNQQAVASAQQLIPLIDQLKTSPPGQEPLAQIRAIDPSMADLLQLFDNLIANTSDASQKSNLVQTRTDFINKSLGGDFENGLKDTISTQNDTIVARANLGDAPIDENFWDTKISISLSKLFRNGIQISPYADADDTGTNFRGKPADSIHGGKGFNDLYTFHGGINVTFPLLRFRGTTAIAAAENAAIVERDAAKLQAQQQLSNSAAATVMAYWDVRAAMETLDVIRRTAEIQSNLLNLTQQLINAGELAGAELSRAQASSARARAQVEDANRQLHQARVALASAMGVSTNGDDASLPLAKDAFPPTPDAATMRGSGQLVGTAPAARFDLQAAQKQQESSRILQSSAETNLRPRLDLTAGTWFTALDENNFSRAVGRWVGPSTQVALNLEKPLGNNLYRGQLTQRQADVRTREIAAIDLQRQIRLSVVQATSSLPDAIAQVQQAEAAVGFYKNIYDADVERFRTGEGTLIDTVITQQSQTEALLALTAARNALAHLIAQLRYQTGTLVGPNGMVAPQNYMTVPTGTAR
ncbi:MAG TPA: TolC family protein [Vicinamibacterales bacterium]|nr:TolC family protein [Vicinamibacterales bacterium]